MAIEAEGTLDTFLDGLKEWLEDTAVDTLLHIKVAKIDTYGNHSDLLEAKVVANPSDEPLPVGHVSEIAQKANEVTTEEAAVDANAPARRIQEALDNDSDTHSDTESHDETTTDKNDVEHVPAPEAAVDANEPAHRISDAVDDHAGEGEGEPA